VSEPTFREGRASDLEGVYLLGETAWDQSRHARGLLPEERMRSEEQLRGEWRRDRPLLEFMTAQQGGSFLVAEDEERIVGYVIVTGFPGMDEMAELWVEGPARALLAELPLARPQPGRGRGGPALGPHALHRVRGHARERPLAHAAQG
jgi:hypothetical protein